MAEAKQPAAPAAPADVEAAFQSSLEDVIAIIESIEQYYESPRELLESLRLASRNKGHLRFLLGKIRK